MHPLDLIAKYINRDNLKASIENIDGICAFTGEKIQEGISLDYLIKENFTDHAYVKYPSEYAGVSAALCMENVLPGKKAQLTALRNYSYLATSDELRILKREDMQHLLFNIPTTPFVLAITYSNKKHTAYKSVLNHNTDTYVITTDAEQVLFERAKAKKILTLMQGWYTIIPEKANTKAAPTFFSKAQIAREASILYSQIKSYGIDKYEQDDVELEKYRNTALFRLLLFILNKTTHVEN